MSKLFTKIALAAGAIAALPAAAQAGTSTATGTATLTVINQCNVAGANINLGTYTTSQTWGDVGNSLGKIDEWGTYVPGSKGLEYMNFGSVTCDAGVPYTLTVTGASHYNIGITHNGKTAKFIPAIKKLGSATVADNDVSVPGAGANVAYYELSGTGTGSAQALLGSAILSFPDMYTSAVPSDTFGATGVATDTLTYTLNF